MYDDLHAAAAPPDTRGIDWAHTAIRRRLSANVLAGRAAMLADAFGADGPDSRAGGAWRWDVLTDQLWFSSGAVRLVADCCGEVSTRAPVFLSHMRLEDRVAVLLALVGALSRGRAVDVDVELGPGSGPGRRTVRLTARRCPGEAHTLIGTLRAA